MIGVQRSTPHSGVCSPMAVGPRGRQQPGQLFQTKSVETFQTSHYQFLNMDLKVHLMWRLPLYSEIYSYTTQTSTTSGSSTTHRFLSPPYFILPPRPPNHADSTHSSSLPPARFRFSCRRCAPTRFRVWSQVWDGWWSPPLPGSSRVSEGCSKPCSSLHRLPPAHTRPRCWGERDRGVQTQILQTRWTLQPPECWISCRWSQIVLCSRLIQ